MVSVDVRYHLKNNIKIKQNSQELRSCVKVDVDVLGSPSLIVRTVSVDTRQHLKKKNKNKENKNKNKHTLSA